MRSYYRIMQGKKSVYVEDAYKEGYIGGNIPEEIYERKLDEAQKEKKTLKSMLDNVDQRIDEWVKKAEEVLDFALHARERYATGKEPVRRHIVSYLGTNLLLGNGILRMELKKPFKAISEHAKEINGIMEGYKPLKETMSREEYHALVRQNPKMGTRCLDWRTFNYTLLSSLHKIVDMNKNILELKESKKMEEAGLLPYVL